MQCPACGAALSDYALVCVCGETLGPVAEIPPVPPASKRKLGFFGEGATLFIVYLLNLLFMLLTAGIYFFWAKIKVRKYFYGQTEFEGDRFVFHGTPKELLIGWLKVAGFFLVTGGIVVALESSGAFDGAALARFLQSIALLFLFPIAMVGSRRYRLSRSSWRNIRFSFRGRAKAFIGTFIRDTLLTGFTLGIYYPVMQHNFREFFVSHSYFGNRRFDYDGNMGELFGVYVKGFLLTLFTLGIYWFWFSAEKQRYYWSHTTFGTAPMRPGGGAESLGSALGHAGVARFRSTVTGGGMLVLTLTNLLLLLVTIGFAYPWVEVRTMRYIFENLYLEGPLDLDLIQQEAQEVSATGEGMAEFLDVGPLDIDLGI